MDMNGAERVPMSEAEKAALVRRELVAMIFRLAHLDGIPTPETALIIQSQLIDDLVAVIGSDAAAELLRKQADLCEAAHIPPDPSLLLAAAQPAGRA